MKNINIRKLKFVEYNNNEFVQYLRKDCVNIFHIPVGSISRGKAEEYIKQFAEMAKDVTEGYKVIYLGKKD